jgi:hypothetical protein
MNPHNRLVALDTKLNAATKWRCTYCGFEGTYDECLESPCMHVYPPCDYCGQTPECAEDCSRIQAIVNDENIRFVGNRVIDDIIDKAKKRTFS